MLDDRRRRPRAALIGFALAIILLVVLCVRSTQMTLRYLETSAWVHHTYLVLAELQTTMLSVTAAESAMRGFALTGNDRFVPPYQSASAELAVHLEDLKRLTTDNPGQQQRLRELQDRLNRRLELSWQVHDARKTGGLSGAAETVTRGEGFAAMAAVRKLVGEMTAEENNLLQQRENRTEQTGKEAIATFLTIGILIIALVSVAFDLIRRQLRAREASESQARDATDHLNNSVAALERRTAQITLLGQFSNRLHGCLSDTEAYGMLSQFSGRLLEGYSGAVYVIAPSRNAAELTHSWGAPTEEEPVLALDDCWALRSGRVNVSGSGYGVTCPHIRRGEEAYHVCAPMAAHGETMGFLTLSHAGQFDPSDLQLLETVTDQLALALANLRLHARVRDQSIRDPLTGLFNRRYMEESLDRELLRASRRGRNLGVVMIDLDRFKSLNDTYGHQAGDTALRAFSDSFRRQVRAEDIACRYGGEEFALIMPEADLETVTARAERIRQATAEISLRHGEQTIASLTMSAGVACFPIHGNDAAELIGKADAALYDAKHRGRNRVVVAPNIPGADRISDRVQIG